MNGSPYRRVLLKMSGEALEGPAGYGIDRPTLTYVATQIQKVHALGIQIGVAVGGGNIWRGEEQAATTGLDRPTADYMGMLATVFNALALKGVLESLNVETRVQSAISMPQLAESYIRQTAIEHLERGRVVVFAAGTGNPFFTTDTAGALRALEIGADVLLMAKNRVDGVYTADPLLNADARRYDRLSFMEALSQGLGVMDAAALSLCMDNHLRIVVFDLTNPENLPRILRGEQVGTLIE
ncbi:MAG: UMP kinase [Chloroflexi bacterium]|nr:UMP kinase [Chloroflexota bacterium]